MKIKKFEKILKNKKNAEIIHYEDYYKHINKIK